MAEEIKAKAVETEEKSLQEKEQEVQKNAGFDEESGMYKVDLTQPPKQEQDAATEQVADEVPVRDESGTSGEISEENVEEQVEESAGEKEETEEVILEEITNEEDTVDDTGVEASPEIADTTPEQKEVLPETKTQESIEYPENIQDLVKFMNETGGTLQDYVELNKDYEKFDNMDLLHEYYSQTKQFFSKYVGGSKSRFLAEAAKVLEDPYKYAQNQGWVDQGSDAVLETANDFFGLIKSGIYYTSPLLMIGDYFLGDDDD